MMKDINRVNKDADTYIVLFLTSIRFHGKYQMWRLKY